MKLHELIQPPVFPLTNLQYKEMLNAVTEKFSLLKDTGRRFTPELILKHCTANNTGGLPINKQPEKTPHSIPHSIVDIFVLFDEKSNQPRAFCFSLRLDKWALIHTLIIFSRNPTNDEKFSYTIPSGAGRWIIEQIKDMHPKNTIMFDTAASKDGRVLIFRTLKNSGAIVANVFTGEFISTDEKDLLAADENTVMVK